MNQSTKKNSTLSPRAIANLQLSAYNNHDLSKFCALFDKNATLTDLPSQSTIAQGIDEIRSIYHKRFAIAELKCVVHSTSDIGDFAIDRETIYGLPGGGPVNIVAMYEVKNNKIQRVFFIRDS